jgi:hypothetical protein
MPNRRHITLVLELDEQGNPAEINRAWQEDEIELPTGGFGMSPRVNVTEATLAGLLPDRAAMTAQLVATQDERRAAAEAKEAAGKEIETLKARLAEIETTPPQANGRSIHKAWLRAALASIERLAEVDAAVQAAGPVHWELWANATTISRDDADVVAIAAALSIDLDAVFAAARAIQAARGA